jgi:hypothetical protein
MPRVAIIGAGEIGSRHLQALALLDEPTRIIVVDPSPEGLQRAAARFAETGSDHQVDYLADLAKVSEPIDVAIVATTSATRRAALEALVARTGVRFVVFEKVLFQQPADYDAVGTLLERHGIRAWVNCARRMWPTYRRFRERHGVLARAALWVHGAQWGLGCNGIHFVDLLAFLTGNDALRFDASLLEPEAAPAKRSGYLEFFGTLSGRTSTGENELRLTHHRSGNAPVTLVLATPELFYVFAEGERKVRFAEAAGGWRWQEEDLELLFQSRLTNLVVQDLLSRGDCELTPYARSCQHHLPFLAALTGHLARSSNQQGSTCPIT